jgi:DNA-binding transcriptional ArsR family regulator
MGLLRFLFKTEHHRVLAELIWRQGMSGSVHEFSQMSGLPYATAHALFQKLKGMGLIRSVRKGRSWVFSSNLRDDELKSLLSLLKTNRESTIFAREGIIDMDIPIVGPSKNLRGLKAKSKEEFLARATALAKKNATLLRVLPVLTYRLGHELKATHLLYWARHMRVERELGFVLELTAILTKQKKFLQLAGSLKDGRWKRPIFFFRPSQPFQKFEARLTEINTPNLARRWFLKMNIEMDSFTSTFSKFSEGIV